MSQLRHHPRRVLASIAATATAFGVIAVPVQAAVAAVVPEPIVHSADGAELSLSPIGTFETGVFDESAAEIVQAHGDRLYVVNAQAGKVDVIDYSDPSDMTKIYSIESTGVANSVAIREDGLGIIAFEATDKVGAGHVVFFDANAKNKAKKLGEVEVGALPDNVAITADGTYALTANEGEPADDFTVDPEGSISVIALPATVAAAAQGDVETADFHAYESAANGGTKSLPDGVRVFGPQPHGADDLPVSRNLEPEYIAVDGGTAYVALQEANAVAVVDIAGAEVTDIWSLGLKDHGDPENKLDPSDRDPNGNPTFNLRNYEGLFGVYMPDGIVSFEAGGETYLATANEGDAREWGSYVEPLRAKDLGKSGVPPLCAGSPLTGKLTDADLGRLNISIADGLNEAGTCYEELHAFGGRSFSIWQTDGTQVFDSGSQFEEITNAANPNFVNSNHTENNKEGRSDDKGPEPENMAVGKVGDKTYAFIGLERVGGIMVYDISDPANSEFVTYVNNRDFSQAPGTPASGDQGAEGVAFIPAEKSATGRPLVAVGNEVSGTTTLFEVDDLKAEIDILTINDFHGRIDASGLGGNGEVGAGGLAGAVDTKRADNPNTLFVSAGDNIGASTFPSFINDDTPTIDALREAGLDLSVVGNHEFDRGLADLKTRVLKRYGGSEFGLGANVYYKGTQTPALDEYAVKTIDGVRVAFIGVVTRQTAAMVTPTGVAGIDFGDQVVAANRVAQEIEDEDLADVTVLLTHDGSAVDTCSTIATEDTDFGELVRGASADIDAIVSAHTHQKYACEIAGPGGENRPVIQAHQYGTTLGRLSLTYDRATDTIESITGSLEALAEKPAGSSSFAQKYPANTAVQTIVDAAVAEADVKGAVQVGTISGDITRGGTAGSDRGVESTAGNTVADIYLWATSNDAYAGKKAQIGIMNPGGLRADMLKGADGTVTYRAAADVQPFANTLVTVDLTGAQLKSVLEEQWQPEGWSRPKLHLGISEGLSYYYDEARAKGDRIIQIRFAGEKVADSDVFTVVTNSFVAVGGDNFFTFPEGANHTDTGQVDLAATVEFFEAHDVVDPSPLGRAIAGEPEPEPDPELIDSTVLVKAAKSSTRYGQANSATVTVKADGKAASGAVQVSLSGKTVVKSAKLSSTGRVTVKLPANTKPGTRTLAVKYLGTDAVEAGKASTKVKVSKAKPTVTGKLAKSSISRTKNGKVAVTVKLPGASGVYATGKVRILDGGKTLKTVTLKAGHKGKVSVTLPKLKKGTHKISVKVLGSSTLNSVTSKQVKLRVS